MASVKVAVRVRPINKRYVWCPVKTVSCQNGFTVARQNSPPVMF